MKDSLSGYSELQTTNDESCETCKLYFGSYLLVEEEDFKRYCFYCYQNRYGLRRFLRQINLMSKEADRAGWDQLDL